jgi:hypothetical protein
MLMTTAIHDTSVKVDVFPDEFKPLLKLINRAISNDDVMKHLTDDEAATISMWLDDFQSLALQHGV